MHRLQCSSCRSNSPSGTRTTLSWSPSRSLSGLSSRDRTCRGCSTSALQKAFCPMTESWRPKTGIQLFGIDTSKTSLHMDQTVITLWNNCFRPILNTGNRVLEESSHLLELPNARRTMEGCQVRKWELWNWTIRNLSHCKWWNERCPKGPICLTRSELIQHLPCSFDGLYGVFDHDLLLLARSSSSLLRQTL